MCKRFDNRKRKSIVVKWILRPARDERFNTKSSFETKTHAFKQQSNFWGNTNELVTPKTVLGVAKQFNESYQGTPRMGSMHDKPLKKYPCHNFFEAVIPDFQEKI